MHLLSAELLTFYPQSGSRWKNDDASVAEASYQPLAKRVKLSSPAPNNIKPVFGRLDVALNTDDSGDITVNVSNTRRLGKPVIDHLSDETFAFHGSRQQAHAMLDKILDHSDNEIIMGIVSLQPDTSKATPQSKVAPTIQTVDLTRAATTASENPTVTKPKTPMIPRPATSTATEKEASAGERPLAPAVTHQSRQTSKVADNPKPFAPQNSLLVLSRGHLEAAYRVWMICGRRITKLQTLLKRFPENDHDGEDVDFPWAKMAPKSSAGCYSSAYATFKEHNGVGINSEFSIFD
ncbi:uncharacterized protein N0V96_003971 [Colletotrichum fioriniae]|uniref:uncharacterized protein n=1 Tax=Colletotrichum fioriniae TaxID=710243 RepID=UPI0032DB2224|nr:hypothetical protein N0V96_003971 [Colletotrichum fioriniae]